MGPGGSQCALRVRRIIVSMDQVVSDARMLGIFLPQRFENASGFKLIGQRRVGGVGVAHRQHRQRIKGLRFKIVGITIVKLAHCFFVRDHPITRPHGVMVHL